MCFPGSTAGGVTAHANQQAAQYQNVLPYINSAFQGGSGTLYTPVSAGTLYDPSQSYYRQTSQGQYVPMSQKGQQFKTAENQGNLFTVSQYNNQGYTPQYYQNAAQDYVNYYMPQEGQQEAATQAQTLYSLANRGVLDSSVATDTMAALNRASNTAQQGIINQGQGVANQLQEQMGTQQSQLQAQAAASVDPSSAGKNAMSIAGQYAQPSPYTPLVNSLFSSFQNAYLPAAYASGNQPTPGYTYGAPVSSDTSVVPGSN